MMTKLPKARLIAGAVALVGLTVLGGGGYWLTHPRPIAECLQPIIDADVRASTDSERLIAMGTLAGESGAHQVSFGRKEFFACTRINSLSQDWPQDADASAAYNLLRLSPSFELGRYITKLKQDVPDLEPERALGTAKLMRSTAGVLEALAQAKSCPDGAATPGAATEELITLSEPYLTAVAWNLGLASTPGNARAGAQSLLQVMAKTVEVPACDSARLKTELDNLRDFKEGQLPGLPCQLKDNPATNGEPELICD